MLRFLTALPLLLLPLFYPVGLFLREEYEFDPLSGVYETNLYLNDAEVKLSNILRAPEAFATRENDSWIYTGVAKGAIVKFDPETFSVQQVAKSEDPGCAGEWDKRCGRPLGLRFRSHSELLVADAVRGLLSVDVDAGTVKTLVPTGFLIDGIPLILANDVDVDDEGNIYFSQSSTDTGLDFGMFTALASGSGRLLKIDAKTGETKVLLTGLHFANGVQLSKDKSFILVAETFKGRIIRYYIKGPKKDTADIFVKGIPGSLDNIRPSGRENGGYLVAVPVVWDPANWNMLELLGNSPITRATIARYLWFIRLPFDWISDVMPNPIVGLIRNSIGGFGLLELFTKVPHSMVVELDESGQVLRTAHAVSTDFFRISVAFPVRGRLLLGTFVHDGLAVVPWN